MKSHSVTTMLLVAAGQCWVIRDNYSNCNCVTPQGPVSCVSWCPLSPDIFLSCSSDWAIHLWKRDHLSPLLGFTSTRGAACDIKWSPKWATVFGAINEEQLEIWDLNSCMWVRLSGGSVIVLCLTLCVSLILCDYHIHLCFSLDPVIVHPAAPGVKMRSLLFATQTDCVLVGGSDGQVTVYQLKNLSVGEGSQVTQRDSFETVYCRDLWGNSFIDE